MSFGGRAWRTLSLLPVVNCGVRGNYFSLLAKFTLCVILALTQVPGKGEMQAQITLETSVDGTTWGTEATGLPDSTAVRERLSDWRQKQRGKAFWEASVDTLYQHAPTTYRALLHRGPKYAWKQLRAPTDDQRLTWLRRAGYRPSQYAGRNLRPGAWEALRDSTVSRAADAGYPFAQVSLDSIEWAAPGELSAKIHIETGPLIRVGEVRYPESARVREVFVQRYLGLQPGAPYNEKRVRRISSRLGQLPYLASGGSPRITFQDSLAFFDLPIQKRTASRFDFVIGVLPGSGVDGGILFTGELNGELYNGFGQGERILARFEQLRPQTQELALQVEYPYVLGLPFGIEGDLDLYRRDSSFLNLNWRVAATYLREGNDRFSFFWENRRTIVPGQSPADIEREPDLPDTLGVIRSFFGLSASRTRTDRRFSPRRGYAFDVSAAAGFRTLQNVPEGDSLNNNRGQFKLEGRLDGYLPAFNGLVLYGGLRGGALFNGGTVLANEQYRVGGARLLRGFDEQFFFARDYLVATAELRLLLGGNAFLYTFVDAARLNRRNQGEPTKPIDYPIGFGVGVNFETRAGIFALNIALGRGNDIPLDIGAPKVHLGYLSVF